jgi:signal transduction histidine kinase
MASANTMRTDTDASERPIAELHSCAERKDRFLALAAHELRGPLAAISSAVQLLSQHTDEPRVVQQSSAMLTRQVAQLARLVEDLFDLARSQNAQIVLRHAPLELESAVAEAVEAAQRGTVNVYSEGPGRGERVRGAPNCTSCTAVSGRPSAQLTLGSPFT